MRTFRGLGIIFACTTALIVMVLGIVTLLTVHHEIERQIDQRIDGEMRYLLAQHREHGFAALVQAVKERDDHALPGAMGYLADPGGRTGREMGYLLVDADGKRLAGSLKADMPPPGWSEFVRFTRADGSIGEAQAFNSAVPGGGRLVVAGDRAMLWAMDHLLLELFGTAFIVLLLLGGLMVFLFDRIIRGRIAALEQAAQSIISGDLSGRIPLDGSGVELDRLAQQFNQILDRLGKMVDNLRAITSGLAHDLRTPLSRLIARMEEAAARSGDPVQQQLIDGALGEVDDMLDLFSGLLAVAEIDGRAMRARFVPIDLADAMLDIAEAHRPPMEDAGMELTFRAQPVIVIGDRTLLQRLVSNLLDNVLSHAPQARQVTLEVMQAGKEAIVRVGDDGPGITESDRTRVFEHLVRLDPARSKQGHGLGLSIVRAIASAHDGKVAIIPSECGTLVELRIPLRQNDDLA